jgi:hypothetical protein
MNTDWIEPETLFWAAWRVLPAAEKAELAREAIAGFVERVEQAAAVDPRPNAANDPMEWHRHRIHPVLWQALQDAPARQPAKDVAARELQAWQARRDEYLARRPIFSQVDRTAPWHAAK